MKNTINIVGVALLAFVLCCRWITPLADFYAQHCYPAISWALSLVAAALPFSLEELTVLGFVAALITAIVRAVRKKTGFFSWLKSTAIIAMWLIVWFYMGWGNNYFRTQIAKRLEIERVSFNKEDFGSFLEDFTAQLNEAAAAASGYDAGTLGSDIREFFDGKPHDYGYTRIRRWQKVKKPLANPLYSAVGVLGFMGPFFCETQVNTDLLDYEYPYVLAHETAHLAGVTREAEASYWGFAFCRQSDNPAVRYSGYQGLLPYVLSHARALLPAEEYKAWTATISQKAVADYEASREYWQDRRVAWINNLQHSAMDLMLRSNKISEGAADYSGVIAILISMDAYEGL